MLTMARKKHKLEDPHVAKLRAIIDRHDMPHAELAEKLAVSIVTLRSWLYGVRKPSRLACKIIDDLKL